MSPRACGGSTRRLRRSPDRQRIVSLRGLLRIDLPAALRGVGLRQHSLQRFGGHGRGIGEPRIAIGERDALGFDEQVQVLGGVVPHRLQIEALEDVQHLERDDALRVRRHLQDVVSTIGRRDGLDPVGPVRREVGLGEERLAAAHVVGDGLGDRPLVERVAPALGDELEGRREARVAEDVARRGGAAAGEERRGCRRIAQQDWLGVLPLRRDDVGDGVAFARVRDRRLQRAIQLQRAVAREQLVPAVHDPGHADRQRAAIRDRVEAPAPVFVRCRRGRRASARVQRAHALRLRVVHDREQVSPDAVHRRLDNGQDRRGGDRRVDGVAALLQDAQPGGGRERLAGGDQTVARQHGRSRASRIGCGTIAWSLRNERHHRRRADNETEWPHVSFSRYLSRHGELRDSNIGACGRRRCRSQAARDGG